MQKKASLRFSDDASLCLSLIHILMEEDEEMIREAIYREIGRGGQVFFLSNRVQNIEQQMLRIQKMVPEARVSFAHGQMAERELENVMMEFVEGAIDILVCTTIIETGLDIPNANTILIADADTMGLAQLYQLRGRVGRSDRLAYAYFMYRKGKVLQEVAQKRLEAIGEFTEFGSGFRTVSYTHLDSWCADFLRYRQS